LRATELAEDGRLSESNAILQAAGALHPTAYLVRSSRKRISWRWPGARGIAQYRRLSNSVRRASRLPWVSATLPIAAGDNDQAIKAYGLALALNPANYIVRLALAKVYMGLNRFEEAAKEQQTVLAAHPRFAPAT